MFKKAVNYIKISLSPIAFERNKKKIHIYIKKRDKQIEILKNKINITRNQTIELKRQLRNVTAKIENNQQIIFQAAVNQNNIKINNLRNTPALKIIYLPFGMGKFASNYKYIEVMKSLYGGIVINDIYNENKILSEEYITKIKELDPSLVVCRGDSYKTYKIPFKLNIPYIVICHDVYSFRTGIESSQEKEMIENAAGLIFPGEPLRNYCYSIYNLPPNEVILLRPLKNNINFKIKKQLEGKHLVYCGSLASRKSKNTLYGYRVYHDIFEAFIKAGWKVHVYPTPNGAKNAQEYKDIGCIIHEHLPYPEMLKEVSKYTAGIQGFNLDEIPKSCHDYALSAIPNKTFDYLAAGIPVIGINPTGSSRTIFEGKWGVIAENLNISYLKNIDKRLPIITDEMRNKEIMENDKNKFDRLIENIMKNKFFY